MFIKLIRISFIITLLNCIDVGDSHASFVRGLSLNQSRPLEYKFLIQKVGNHQAEINNKAMLWFRYSLTGVIFPSSDWWVNLSPFEYDRVIDKNLEESYLGEVLLKQDMMLKKHAALLIDPESPTGKKFWEEYNHRTKGSVQPAIFNKVWILPDRIEILINDHEVFIKTATLKVMVEKDYLAFRKFSKSSNAESVDEIATEIYRKHIIPELNRLVNYSTDFEDVRNVYYALIIANWYKSHISSRIDDYIDSKVVLGDVKQERHYKGLLYKEYLRHYKRGFVNKIIESKDSNNQLIVKKYFSGGVIIDTDKAMYVQIVNKPWLLGLAGASAIAITMSLDLEPLPLKSEYSSTERIRVVSGVLEKPLSRHRLLIDDQNPQLALNMVVEFFESSKRDEIFAKGTNKLSELLLANSLFNYQMPVFKKIVEEVLKRYRDLPQLDQEVVKEQVLLALLKSLDDGVDEKWLQIYKDFLGEIDNDLYLRELLALIQNRIDEINDNKRQLIFNYSFSYIEGQISLFPQWDSSAYSNSEKKYQRKVHQFLRQGNDRIRLINAIQTGQEADSEAVGGIDLNIKVGVQRAVRLNKKNQLFPLKIRFQEFEQLNMR